MGNDREKERVCTNDKYFNRRQTQRRLLLMQDLKPGRCNGCLICRALTYPSETSVFRETTKSDLRV